MSIWINDKLIDKFYHLDIQSQIGSRRILIHDISFSNRDNILPKTAHKCLEFSYLIQGKEILLVENKRIPLHEGMVFYIGPNTLHQAIHNLPGNYYYLQCSIRFNLQKVYTPHRKNILFAEDEMTSLERSFNHHKFWVGNDSEGCINLIQNILKELSHGWVGYYSVIQNMLANLIVLSIRCMSQKQKAVADYNVPIKINYDAVQRIRNFIRSKYRYNITREDAAHSIFVSARHIDRILHEHFGLTFQQLLQQFRLEMVKKKLSETNLSLERIAEDVGIASASHLCTLFKEKEGITTSAFRQQRFPNGVKPRPE